MSERDFDSRGADDRSSSSAFAGGSNAADDTNRSSAPLPEHIARPSYWPPLLALAMTLALLGPVTAPLVGAAGLIFAAVALAGWIGDILHD